MVELYIVSCLGILGLVGALAFMRYMRKKEREVRAAREALLSHNAAADAQLIGWLAVNKSQQPLVPGPAEQVSERVFDRQYMGRFMPRAEFEKMHKVATVRPDPPPPPPPAVRRHPLDASVIVNPAPFTDPAPFTFPDHPVVPTSDAVFDNVDSGSSTSDYSGGGGESGGGGATSDF